VKEVGLRGLFSTRKEEEAPDLDEGGEKVKKDRSSEIWGDATAQKHTL